MTTTADGQTDGRAENNRARPTRWRGPNYLIWVKTAETLSWCARIGFHLPYIFLHPPFQLGVDSDKYKMTLLCQFHHELTRYQTMSSCQILTSLFAVKKNIYFFTLCMLSFFFFFFFFLCFNLDVSVKNFSVMLGRVF